MTHAVLAALTLAAYILGSMPFGLWVGLLKGVDVRSAGSGNIGATNVGRLLGGKFFAMVFTLDLLKSLLPMLIAAAVVHRDGRPASEYSAITYLLWLLVGFAAVAGHMFSVFLKFKGGKGVATSAGLLLGLYPFFTLPAVVAILVFIVVFMAWRYVSLGSIAAAGVFPLAYLGMGLAMGWPVFSRQLPLLICACLIAALIIYRHRANIARLRQGTEPSFREKSA